MPPAYTCNFIGTCSGTTPQQTALFTQLQRELNRVRARIGMPPDVAVDGKIGAGTVAKLIKTAEKLVGAEREANKLDRMIYNIATGATGSGSGVSTAYVAANALNILQALERNGYSEVYWSVYDPTHNPNPAGGSMSPGVTINPYASTVSVNTGVKINPTVVSVLPVGPTSGGQPIMPQQPGSYASPGFTTGFEMPLWAKIGLGVLGAGLVVGVGAAALRRR